MKRKLALIGFGEAGSTFAAAAGWAGAAAAWDLLTERREAAAGLGLAPAETAAQALDGASLVLSLVVADQAVPAARACAPLLEPGAWWCDMNSVSPGAKREAAVIVAKAGGRYVDAAILAPVHPAGMAVPLLLAGEQADEAEALLGEAGFTNARVVGPEIGRASAIKMIRSVMVKGIEALTAEMMQAAEAAGVTDEVLASLDASDKAMPWRARAAYNVERMVTHGLRRAAEMAESAATLAELGVDPVMTTGTALRQRAMAGRTDLLIAGQGASV